MDKNIIFQKQTNGNKHNNKEAAPGAVGAEEHGEIAGGIEGEEEKRGRRSRRRREARRRKGEEVEDEEGEDGKEEEEKVNNNSKKKKNSKNNRNNKLQKKKIFCLCVGCLTSQLQASVSQGRMCEDNFTCCHTEIEVADQTIYLTQSQYTDTGPTSPSADPITPGTRQGSHWSAYF